ncbi:RNA methyltransferase [Thermoplasmatales archaeon SW_10_69_26]|nr:MAG: RNA methyltransferase [Thermoplasmatales archaeon SW_10_69_26]
MTDRGLEQGERFRVVLVEPKYEGNVGAVARVCANFGVDDLVVVEGPELTDRAQMMAVHADDLLDDAETVDSLEVGLQGTNLAVGFTAQLAGKTQDHVRDGLALPEAADTARRMQGTLALVFGREDDGLSIDELELMDVVTRIPVHEDYPSMNLSHAASVGLYELVARGRWAPERRASATKEQMEILFATLEHVGKQARVRDHKLTLMLRCLRRVFGRTRVSTWEYHRMMGLFTRTLKQMDAWPVPTVKEGVLDED